MFNWLKKITRQTEEQAVQTPVVYPGFQRIYYPGKKLMGQPVKSPTINTAALMHLLELNNEYIKLDNSLVLQDNTYTNKPNLYEFTGKPSSDYFEFAHISLEDIEYRPSNAPIEYTYLPTNLQMYDQNSPFTYFVATVEGKCELQSLSHTVTNADAPNHMAWYDSVGQFQNVDSQDIIHKVENTLAVYEKYIQARIAELKQIKINEKKMLQLQIDENKQDFAPVMEALKEALSFIGVTPQGFDYMIKKAIKDSSPMEEILTYLCNKRVLGYLDFKDTIVEVDFTLQTISKKQKYASPPNFEDNGLTCDDAAEYAAKQINMWRIFLIDADTDGSYIGIVPLNQASQFTQIMSDVFSEVENGFCKIRLLDMA